MPALFCFCFKIDKFGFYMCRCFACMYACVPCVFSAQGGLDRVLELLKLEPLKIVRHLMDAGDRVWVSNLLTSETIL